jgi:hypothetical protein
MLSCVVIGGGPGGLGPLIAAAQQGLLPDWLDQGIAIVEQEQRLGGSLGRFAILSDSLGGSYLEFLDATGLPEAMQALRDDPVAREMAGYRQSFPPLELVDRFMGRIGSAVAAMLQQSSTSSLRLGTRARHLRLCDDGSIAVEMFGPGGSETLVARSAILALGGRQLLAHQTVAPGLSLAHGTTHNVMPSDRLLSRAGLADADRRLAKAKGRQILILGGAHSAYSAAAALVGLPAAAGFGAGQIAIVQRREPRVFYPDRAAAHADGYAVHDGDICSRTGRVNRMGGLRGHGREMWRSIARRPGSEPEPRVIARAIQDFAVDELRAAIADAALAVPCFGYRSVTLPIQAASGEWLELNADQGGAAVGDDSRLMLGDGSCLANVFGIGLGTGYRPPASMGGEPNFSGQINSLWLYQNDIGAAIHRVIQGLGREPESPHPKEHRASVRPEGWATSAA